MQNPRLSAIYAKSIADLAQEKDQFSKVFEDMKYISSLCSVSPEFVQLMKSPVVYADKKQSIFSAITKGNVVEITSVFVSLLIRKGREGFLPEIAKAFITEYNKRNQINTVKITSADQISETVKKSILDKLKTEAGFEKVELETAVDSDLIGGFVLEYNNNLVDASIARDLRDIKKQFQSNIYVQNIR